MRKKQVLLSEADFIKLIKRIVKETKEAEMEEGWLGDKMKDVKRFATGYGDEEEKSGAESEFYSSLDEIEAEVLSDIEEFRYEDEDGWETAKDKLIQQAEDNNYLGELEIMYPRRTGKAFVKYHEGRSRGKAIMQGLGSAAGSTTRSYQSRTKGY